MLDQAGITGTTTQLEINVCLNAWCLCVAVVGTFFCDLIGRKALAIVSTLGCAVLIFVVGALTKTFGTSTYTPGIYGTVAAIFLFQGAYSFGWTPLSVLYPPEVLNYNIRSVGMGTYASSNDRASADILLSPQASTPSSRMAPDCWLHSHSLTP